MNYEITIPVLNEEKTLEKNVLKVLSFFKQNNLDQFTVCIADNGSNDHTADIARKMSNDYQQVRFVSVPERGVGRALKKAWMTSNADVVGYMDLDLSTDLGHVLNVQKIFTEDLRVNVLYGSRLTKGAKVVGRKLSRELASRVLNILIRRIFKNDISDSMCGFKFYTKETIKKVMNQGAESDGWFFCAETLIVAHRLGYKIKEIPVIWVDDAESKVKILKLSLEYLKAINKLKKKKFI